MMTTAGLCSASSLGKRASMRRERNLDELSSYLSEHERQTLVIVMDDAQNATHGTLEELRLLFHGKLAQCHAAIEFCLRAGYTLGTAL